PVVVGILKPMILVPATLLSGLSVDQVEAILAHELAHLRRRDHVVQLLQRLIESVLFFHPAVWWVSHRIHVEREHCCDDLAAAAHGSARDYARSLVRAAELCVAGSLDAPAMALSAMNRPSSLRRRVMRLLQGRSTPQVRVSRVWIFVAIVTVTLGTSVLYHRSSAARAEEPKPTTKPATQPTRQVSGMLVDSQNRPVSNAYIAPAGNNPWYGVRSDVNGRFTVTLKASDRHLVAYSQRSGKLALFDADRDMSKPIVFNQRDAEVDGRVVDA